MSNQATAEKVEVSTAQDFVEGMAAAMPDLKTKLSEVRLTVQNWTHAAAVFSEPEDLTVVLQGMVDCVVELQGLSVERFVKFLKISSTDISIAFNKKQDKYIVKIGDKSQDSCSFTPDGETMWWDCDPNHSDGVSVPQELEAALKSFINKRQNKAGDNIQTLSAYFTQEALDLVASKDF